MIVQRNMWVEASAQMLGNKEELIFIATAEARTHRVNLAEAQTACMMMTWQIWMSGSAD